MGGETERARECEIHTDKEVEESGTAWSEAVGVKKKRIIRE